MFEVMRRRYRKLAKMSYIRKPEILRAVSKSASTDERTMDLSRISWNHRALVGQMNVPVLIIIVLSMATCYAFSYRCRPLDLEFTVLVQVGTPAALDFWNHFKIYHHLLPSFAEGLGSVSFAAIARVDWEGIRRDLECLRCLSLVWIRATWSPAVRIREYKICAQESGPTPRDFFHLIL